MLRKVDYLLRARSDTGNIINGFNMYKDYGKNSGRIFVTHIHIKK